MLDNDKNESKEFHYFDDEGIFIGKSEGASPQKELFDQAHYVFDAQNEFVKNRDLLAIAIRKLANLRRRLLGVPIADITRIMEINQEINELEKNIDRLSAEESASLHPSPPNQSH